MYTIGVQEYLILEHKINLISEYIDEFIGADYEIEEFSITIFDITQSEHEALRAYISKHHAWGYL